MLVMWKIKTDNQLHCNCTVSWGACYMLSMKVMSLPFEFLTNNEKILLTTKVKLRLNYLIFFLLHYVLLCVFSVPGLCLKELTPIINPVQSVAAGQCTKMSFSPSTSSVSASKLCRNSLLGVWNKAWKDLCPRNICRSSLERVDSFEYLVVQITKDLTLALHTDSESLFHLRHLRKFQVSHHILKNFYSCTIKSILMENITAWYGNSGEQAARPCKQ